MNYKYNEKEYGKAIKEKGFQSKFIRYELVVLVKYLNEVEEKTKKEIVTFLYDFCKKNIEDFNEVIYYKVIDGAVRDGRKKDNKLITLDNIPITKNELEYIDNLQLDEEYKKLLFTLLVKKKISYEINKIQNEKAGLSAYFNGTNKTYRESFKMGNIKTSGYKIDDMINELIKKGEIESIINGDIVLLYMFNIYDIYTETIESRNKNTQELELQERKHIKYEIKDEDVFDKITDFENIGYFFEWYKKNPSIKKCEKCEGFIKIKGNKTKYCKNCAEEILQQQWKSASKKYRDNKTS